MQKENIGKLTQEIAALKSTIIELEENIALKQQEPLQSGD
jgi:hypothetical protein